METHQWFVLHTAVYRVLPSVSRMKVVMMTVCRGCHRFCSLQHQSTISQLVHQISKPLEEVQGKDGKQNKSRQ